MLFIVIHGKTETLRPLTCTCLASPTPKPSPVLFSLSLAGQGEHFSWLTCCLKLSLQLVHLLDETTSCRIMQWSIWMWIHIGIIWAWSCQEWSKVARPWSSLHLNLGPSSHYESCLGHSWPIYVFGHREVCLPWDAQRGSETFGPLGNPRCWSQVGLGLKGRIPRRETNFLSLLKWFGDARGWWSFFWMNIHLPNLPATHGCFMVFTFTYVYQGTRLTHSHLGPSGLWFLNLLQIGCLEPAWCGDSVAWKCIANGSACPRNRKGSPCFIIDIQSYQSCCFCVYPAVLIFDGLQVGKKHPPDIW